jgi:hypothetical protein
MIQVATTAKVMRGARLARNFVTSRSHGLSGRPPLLPLGSRRCFAEEATSSVPGGGKGVVLSKRLPEDFIENTLRPHLESQLLNNIHAYTPAELVKIARAYSKQDAMQYPLSKKLVDTVKWRIDGFEAVDVIDIMSAMWQMAPGDDELFEVMEKRIIKKLDDFTALNLMGLIRIFNKRASKHHDFLSEVLPRLRKLLGDYEALELSEMLVSMAQAPEAAADMDILMTLVPEVERRYTEVSLVQAINNIWALTQLKVVHPRMLDLVAADLNNPKKSQDLTPAYMARCTWVYRRCNQWDKVSAVMLPLLKSAAAEFRCGEFARLAQALPEEEALLHRIAGALRPSIDDMGRKDFMFFFLGCVHGEILEPAPQDLKDSDSLISKCLEYVFDEQDNFKREEVQRIIFLLQHAKKYSHLLDELPVSWNATKEETLDYIRAKG